MTLLDTALLPHGGSWDERRPLHGQPRPRHVVPPAVPGRRVAALRPGHPVGLGGPRASGRGSIFTADGHLAVTVVQEGLIRVTRAVSRARLAAVALAVGPPRRVRRRLRPAADGDAPTTLDRPRHHDEHHRTTGPPTRPRSTTSTLATERGGHASTTPIGAGRPARHARPLRRRAGRAGPADRGRPTSRRRRAHRTGSSTTPVLDLSDRGDQRGRAGAARAGLLERRPPALRRSPRSSPTAAPWLGEFDVGDGTHDRRRRAAATLLDARPAVPEPQRRPAGPRPRRLPLRRPRRRRRAAATPTATARTPPTLLGKILRIDPEGGARAATGRTPSRRATRSPTASGAPEIWLLRRAQPVAVHVRPRQRRPLDRRRRPGRVGGDRPPPRRRRRRRRPRGATSAGTSMEGTPPVRRRRRTPTAACCPSSSTTTTTAAARSSAATCTGATAIPDLQGAYLFADYCRAGLSALTLGGRRDAVDGARTFDLPVAAGAVLRRGRRRRALPAPRRPARSCASWRDRDRRDRACPTTPRRSSTSPPRTSGPSPRTRGRWCPPGSPPRGSSTARPGPSWPAPSSATSPGSPSSCCSASTRPRSSPTCGGRRAGPASTTRTSTGRSGLTDVAEVDHAGVAPEPRAPGPSPASAGPPHLARTRRRRPPAASTWSSRMPLSTSRPPGATRRDEVGGEVEQRAPADVGDHHVEGLVRRSATGLERARTRSATPLAAAFASVAATASGSTSTATTSAAPSRRPPPRARRCRSRRRAPGRPAARGPRARRRRGGWTRGTRSRRPGPGRAPPPGRRRRAASARRDPRRVQHRRRGRPGRARPRSARRRGSRRRRRRAPTGAQRRVDRGEIGDVGGQAHPASRRGRPPARRTAGPARGRRRPAPPGRRRPRPAPRIRVRRHRRSCTGRVMARREEPGGPC